MVTQFSLKMPFVAVTTVYLSHQLPSPTCKFLIELGLEVGERSRDVPSLPQLRSTGLQGMTEGETYNDSQTLGRAEYWHCGMLMQFGDLQLRYNLR